MYIGYANAKKVGLVVVCVVVNVGGMGEPI